MPRIIAFLLSIISIFTSLFGASDGNLPVADDDFVPVIRFFACSDTHVTENYEQSERAGRITKLFNLAYDFAESNPYYTKLDAALFVGDCTDNGKDNEFEIFDAEIKAGIREETTLLAIAANNHDGYIGKSCLEKISEITGLDSDFHVVINGYHFIGISCSATENAHYSPYQRVWLRQQLKEASADDPNKPIFVCHHEHVLESVYGSDILDQWGNLYFKDILACYPQVVHFSGHSHYPLNDPRSIAQIGFTTIGTGSMSYAEYRYGIDIKIRPEGNGRCAQAWIVEADANNNIRLTGIDVNDGGILCQYVLPTTCDSSERVFTKANIFKISSAPKFAEDATLTVTDNNDGTYTVIAPAAESTDGFVVFSYRIRVYDKLGIQTHTEEIVNDYFLNVSRSETVFTIDAKPGYSIEVTAENSCYMSSEALCATIV